MHVLGTINIHPTGHLQLIIEIWFVLLEPDTIWPLWNECLPLTEDQLFVTGLRLNGSMHDSLGLSWHVQAFWITLMLLRHMMQLLLSSDIDALTRTYWIPGLVVGRFFGCLIYSRSYFTSWLHSRSYGWITSTTIVDCINVTWNISLHNRWAGERPIYPRREQSGIVY